MEFAVFNRRIYTGTVSVLPYAARLAWGVVLFEGEKLHGKVKLPVYDLSRWAAITVDEAAEALRKFQEADPHSSSKIDDGRRLRPVPGEEDWYEIINWDKHLEERQVFFNRLRQQRFKAKRQRVTVGNAGNAEQRSVTKEPELEPELEEELRSLPSEQNSGKSKSKALLSSAEPPTEPKAPKKTAKDLVEALVVDLDMRSWATKNAAGVDVDFETDNWRDYLRANGYRTKAGPVKDAAASWRTWMKNARKFAQGGANGRRNGSQLPRTDQPSFADFGGVTKTIDDLRREQELRKMQKPAAG